MGPLRCLGSGDAEEMPGSVLDVVGVDSAVRLELLAAVLVAADIVQHDPALPQLGCRVWFQRGDPIETGSRFFETAVLEIGNRAIEDRSSVSRRLRGGAGGGGEERH